MSRADEFRNATKLERTERLQIKLPPDELAAIDAFRYETRMPSRAAAVNRPPVSSRTRRFETT
jgi:hypothetical protein